MTRNSIALMRDGSVMADSDLVDFLSGPTDSAINFNGSADLHTPIHHPPNQSSPLTMISERLHLLDQTSKAPLAGQAPQVSYS